MLRAAALLQLARQELGRGGPSAAARVLVKAAEEAFFFHYMDSLKDLLAGCAPFWLIMYWLAGCWVSAKSMLGAVTGATELKAQHSFVARSGSAVLPLRLARVFRRSSAVVRLGPDDDEMRWWQQQLLYVVGRMLWHRGVFWWVSHGTLLGAARHRGPVPGDTDVDIDIMGYDAPALDALDFRAQLQRNGVRTSPFLRGHWFFRMWPSGMIDPHLDISLVNGHPNLDRLSYLSNSPLYSGFTWRSLPKKKWKFLRFGALQVVAPGNYEEYLSGMYGPDWNYTMRLNCTVEGCDRSSAGTAVRPEDRHPAPLQQRLCPPKP